MWVIVRRNLVRDVSGDVKRQQISTNSSGIASARINLIRTAFWRCIGNACYTRSSLKKLLNRPMFRHFSADYTALSFAQQRETHLHNLHSVVLFLFPQSHIHSSTWLLQTSPPASMLPLRISRCCSQLNATSAPRTRRCTWSRMCGRQGPMEST